MKRSRICTGSRRVVPVPGLSSMRTPISMGSEAEKEKIAQILEGVIAQCEPRLRNVRASVTTQVKEQGRALRFHIDAQLNVDPSPEVAFVTVVDLMTGKTSIQQRDK